MTGDFRQTMPVIPRGTKVDELYSCIKASWLWRHVRRYRLSKNIRVQLTGDPDAKNFEKVLLDIGEGKLGESGYIQIPPHVMVKTKEEMFDAIFPGKADHFSSLHSKIQFET